MSLFGGLQRGEDTAQLHSTLNTGKKVVYLDLPDLYIYRIHGRNVWDSGHFENLFGPGSSALSEEGRLRVASTLERQ